jgi:hypothetical protein
VDTSASSLRQPDRDRLFGRSRSVLAFPDMVHLLAHEFTRLRGGGFARALVATRSFERFFFWHDLNSFRRSR